MGSHSWPLWIPPLTADESLADLRGSSMPGPCFCSPLAPTVKTWLIFHYTTHSVSPCCQEIRRDIHGTIENPSSIAQFYVPLNTPSSKPSCTDKTLDLNLGTHHPRTFSSLHSPQPQTTPSHTFPASITSLTCQISSHQLICVCPTGSSP